MICLVTPLSLLVTSQNLRTNPVAKQTASKIVAHSPHSQESSEFMARSATGRTRPAENRGEAVLFEINQAIGGGEATAIAIKWLELR